MRRTASYYIDSTTEDVLTERSANTPSHSKSAVLNHILDRYDSVVRRSLPEFSVNEWKLIFESLEGVVFEPAGTIALLEYGIEDSIQVHELDKKWQVNGEALVNKLRTLEYAQKIAVVDLAERYSIAAFRGEEAKLPGEE